MVDVAQAAKAVAKLTALKFFPADKEGRTAIVQAICEMATSNAQIDWVVEQMLNWYNEWPGPREMRGVFCQRWKPATGPNVNASQVLPGGLFPGCQATAPAVPAIPQAEARKLLQAAAVPVSILPATKKTPRAPVAQNSGGLIGQAEIDSAVRALHEQRARRELGLE